MSTTATKELISYQAIEITPIDLGLGEELSDKIHYECNFCKKVVGLYPEKRKICERLSYRKGFFCPFCIRHNFHTRINKNILMLSFRGVIGYLYHRKYIKKDLWYSELADFIDSHAEVGLENPVFNYDPETYLWFIDFSKVGISRRKIKVKDVMKTIINIMACFNLYDHISQNEMVDFYNKYKEAVDKFATERYRPEGKPILIPSLTGIYQLDKDKISIEDIKAFTAADFISKNV